MNRHWGAIARGPGTNEGSASADRKTKKHQTNSAVDEGRGDPTTGSYFLSLELENVRCFTEKQMLDLSDGNGQPRKWTILLGENGSGKTTILQLLASFHWMNAFGSNRVPAAVGPEIIRSVISGYLFGGTLIRNQDGPWPQIRIDVACDMNQIDELVHFQPNLF